MVKLISPFTTAVALGGSAAADQAPLSVRIPLPRSLAQLRWWTTAHLQHTPRFHGQNGFLCILPNFSRQLSHCSMTPNFQLMSCCCFPLCISYPAVICILQSEVQSPKQIFWGAWLFFFPVIARKCLFKQDCSLYFMYYSVFHKMLF